MTQPIEDTIEHRETSGRGEFYVERDGKRVAELTYSRSGGEAIAGHTWVDPSLRGGTLAPRLVRAMVEWARAGDRRIVPICSYVRAVFEPHAQVRGHLEALGFLARFRRPRRRSLTAPRRGSSPAGAR